MILQSLLAHTSDWLKGLPSGTSPIYGYVTGYSDDNTVENSGNVYINTYIELLLI